MDATLWILPKSGAVTSEPTHSFSPVVDRGLVIFHIGGHEQGALTAFNAETGDAKWHWDGDGPAYASPIMAEFEGTRQVITFTQNNLIGVAAESGELLWKRPYTVPFTQNNITSILSRPVTNRCRPIRSPTAPRGHSPRSRAIACSSRT